MSADVDEPVSIAEPDLAWLQIATGLTDECRAVCADAAAVTVEHGRRARSIGL